MTRTLSMRALPPVLALLRHRGRRWISFHFFHFTLWVVLLCGAGRMRREVRKKLLQWDGCDGLGTAHMHPSSDAHNGSRGIPLGGCCFWVPSHPNASSRIPPATRAGWRGAGFVFLMPTQLNPCLLQALPTSRVPPRWRNLS